MPEHMSDDIAVVGIAHRLPQDVEDDASFWEVLQGAKNLSSGWPEQRMNADAHPHPRNGKVSFECVTGRRLAATQSAGARTAPALHRTGEATLCYA